VLVHEDEAYRRPPLTNCIFGTSLTQPPKRQSNRKITAAVSLPEIAGLLVADGVALHPDRFHTFVADDELGTLAGHPVVLQPDQRKELHTGDDLGHGLVG